MKKKQFEMILQKVPFPEKPIPELEQYMTPATIAADIILIAYQSGDIQDKIVIDLGCGTGIFATGAYLAGAKKAIGFDIDKNLITIAKQHAKNNQYMINYHVCDISNVTTKCETVLMNPPFGAQKSNLQADRRFIEKAFQISNTIYSLHLTKTVPFLEKMIQALHGKIIFQKQYPFPIPAIFSFHEKPMVTYEVTLLRIETKKQ
jgi:putative methylase